MSMRNKIDPTVMVYNNLSGKFRVTRREGTAMFGLRDMGCSINHISKLLGRSTSTVHNWTKGLSIIHDNRKLSPAARTNGVIGFMNSLGSLKLRVKCFLMGIYETWDEAMDAKLVPLSLIDYFAEKRNENSYEDEEEEPG